MKKLMKMSMLLAVVGLMAGPASAALVYDTGFETADTFSDGTSVNGIDDWTVDYATCTTEDDNKISGDLSLEVARPSGSSQGRCYNEFTASGIISATFKAVKLDGTTGDSGAFYLMDGGSRATSVTLTETSAGALTLTATGGAVGNIATGLSFGTTYTIRMEANCATKKYNVYLDGVRKATGYDFRDAGVGDTMNRIRMFCNDATTAAPIVVDDLRVWNTVRETGFGTEDGFTAGGSIQDKGGWTVYTGSCTTVASGIDGMSLNVKDSGTADGRAELRFLKTPDVVVTCDVKTSYSSGNSYIQLFDGSRASGDEAVRIVFDSGKGLFAYTGETKGDSLMSFSSDVVYGVKIVVDNDASTYDLYIDSGAGYVLEADNYGFYETAGNVDMLMFTNDSTTADALMDNLVIVPEPATMVLLLLGLPFALRRRR